MESYKQNNRTFGSQGEKIAAEYLKKEGYYIKYLNYRVGRLGEIDIIALHDEYICFVEVKTRTSTNFGMPSEAVNAKKQANIHKIASIYLNKNNLYNNNIRFDVIEILGTKINNSFEVKSINLIKNAF